MSDTQLDYLAREVKAERERSWHIADPLQQARSLDLLAFFDARIKAARLMP